MLLPACISQKVSKKNNTLSNAFTIPKDSAISAHYPFIPWTENPDQLQEFQEKLSDIPRLLGQNLERAALVYSDQGMRSLLEYTIAYDVHDLLHWYDAHMEQAGWQKIDDIISFYAIRWYEKPGKLCQIVLMPRQNHQRLKKARHKNTMQALNILIAVTQLSDGSKKKDGRQKTVSWL